MAQYRKKPVVIEAEHLSDENGYDGNAVVVIPDDSAYQQARARIAALEQLAAVMLAEFHAAGDGHRARVEQVTVARWRKVLDPAGYQHAEAFCLMTYRSDDGTEEEVVWNSRDGVTPLVITLLSGQKATHVNWSADRPHPDHKPQHGERYFGGPPDGPRLIIQLGDPQ
jgi:hypothetical protein